MPKSAIDVTLVTPTAADRRRWAAAWGDNPRLVLVGQRYTEGRLARFAAVADPLLRRHLRFGTASADVVKDEVLVEIYPIDPALWFLLAADGPVLTLGVFGGGFTFYDHIDVAERSGVRAGIGRRWSTSDAEGSGA